MEAKQTPSWSGTWLMTFIPSKCKVMRMGQGESMPRYYLGKSKLPNSVGEKDLGINIILNLLQESHMKRIVMETDSMTANITEVVKHKPSFYI